mgnify:CR=1 FL=1
MLLNDDLMLFSPRCRDTIVLILHFMTVAMISSLKGLVRTYRRFSKSVSSVEAFIKPYLSDKLVNGTALDLGCGSNPRNPFSSKSFFGVDIRADICVPSVHQADLSHEDVPFANDTFDIVSAFDFLEHIPRISYKDGRSSYSFITLMNEVYRVLKPSGFFLYSFPVYPAPEAFQDPTHVNIMTENTIPYYFCEPRSWAKSLGYGFSGRFELVQQAWLSHNSVIGLLRSQ